MSSIAVKRKIKVAFILTPIDFGGAEKVSLNFLKSFDQNKFDILPIILIRPWEDKVFFAQEIEKYKMAYLTIPVEMKLSSGRRDYFRVFRCFKILFSILMRHKYDIIHSNGYFADILGVSVAKMLRIPHVSTCHGYIAADRNLAIYNALDRFFLRFSTKIIAVSNSIKIALINSGVKASRIKIIKNAVPIDIDSAIFVRNRHETRQIVGVDDNDFVVGYIGRLSEEKGIKYLIEAIATLSLSGLLLKLLLTGDGPSEKVLKEMVKRKGLERVVIFTGFQSDIVPWISAIDVFALPSLTEGTPMALLEAMSFGIPVVASAVGGIPQVIEQGKNGILVPPGKSDDIANAILDMFRNNGLRTNISEAAKETIKSKFNLNVWVQKIESVYLEVISSSTSRPAKSI